MAFDREHALKEAERLLKQGRVDAALSELQRVAQRAPNDLPILNRMGDLLAKQGRHDEAISYYEKIAQGFKRGGFLPKSVAIYKKILRIDPDRGQALMELGELFLTQELPGEACVYLLRAAELHLREQRFDQAREVYERLVAAAPNDPRHRARLAEARAAEGDTERAAAELIGLAASLRQSGKTAEAEQSYRRADELAPERPEAAIGLAACLFDLGRDDDALRFLEERTRGDSADPMLFGELALRYFAANRADEAFEVLLGAGGKTPPESSDRFFRECLKLELTGDVWSGIDGFVEGWSAEDRKTRLVPLLERQATLERGGHVPALERLLAFHEDEDGDVAGMLERLVRAYQARSMKAQASEARERLKKLKPDSELLSGADAPAVARKGAKKASPPPVEVDESLLREAEQPACPESRADEEFVNGRLTQAEIFEKYGLGDQALEQLREVTERFPGHVAALERLVTRLKAEGDEPAQRDALVRLAVARRAAGDAAAARAAARRAAGTAKLDAQARALLERLELLPQAGEPEPAPKRSGAAKPAAKTEQAAAPEVVIDFDMGEDEPSAGAPEPPEKAAKRSAAKPKPAAAASAAERPEKEPAGAAPGVRAPDPELVAQIEGLIQQGRGAEARQRIEALRILGYGGDAIERLAAACAVLQPEPPAARHAVPEPGLDDEDDLSAITAALESELFEADSAEPLSPENEDQESLEEVFASFKQHVQAEVEGDDYRTHYDLGIAYKEMGLVDDAIEEFHLAAGTDDLKGESAAMLALCHRQKGDTEQAARWYREALESASLDEDTRRGLSYDLADVLQGAGDTEGALDLFREVLQSDPTYRDVQNRVSELETRLGS